MRPSIESNPSLSVVMPVTGRVELLAKTLDSLAVQTFRDWELVAPDDTPDAAERENIAKLLAEWTARTGIPCRRIFTEPRLYQSRNTNQGLFAARGRWVRILHSDDLLAPWALANEMSLIEKLHPCAEVLFSDPVMFRDTFVPVRKHSLTLLSPRHLVRCFLHTGTALPSCTLFSRAALERVGGFDPGYTFLCDWKFFFRLVLDQLRQGRSVVRVSAAWVGWRQHADSVTSRGWAVHFREHLALMGELIAGSELEHLVELEPAEREEFFLAGRLYRHRRLRADHNARPAEVRPAELEEIESLLAADPLTHEAQLALNAERADAAVDPAWECMVARSLARQGRIDAALLRAEALAEVCGSAQEVVGLRDTVVRLALEQAIASRDAELIARTRSVVFGERLQRAETLLSRQAYPAAARDFRGILAWDPEHPAALLGLGHCCISLGQPAEAVFHYRTALLGDKRNPDIQNCLAYAFLESGDPSSALPLLEAAVEAAPAHAAIRANLARALNELYRAADALPHLREACAIEPSRIDLQLGYARALASLGHAEEAIAGCDRALALDPFNAEAKELKERATPFGGHYDAWRDTRFDYIVERFGADAFRGRSLLEMGAGYGILGSRFSRLGARVTCAEARPEHVAKGASLFPEMRFVEQNLDEDFRALGVHDIVLHTGLLYHLSNIENHLLWLGAITGEWLILETEVADSDDPGLILTINEHKEAYDQSFTGTGTRPSAAYIENILERAGFEVERFDDGRINADFHRYDWKVTNRTDWKFGRWEHGLRRFWLCRKAPAASVLPSFPSPVAQLAIA